MFRVAPLHFATPGSSMLGMARLMLLLCRIVCCEHRGYRARAHLVD